MCGPRTGSTLRRMPGTGFDGCFQLTRIEQPPTLTTEPVEHRVTVLTLQSIAARVQFLFAQRTQLDPQLFELVSQHAAGPVQVAGAGVGPVVVAQLLISWLRSGRVRSEAAFATLTGVAPLEVSSWHRLSRGSDSADLHRCAGAVCGALTKISVVVEASGAGAAIAGHGQCNISTTVDGGDSGEASEPKGCAGTTSAAAAELAIEVVPPDHTWPSLVNANHRAVYAFAVRVAVRAHRTGRNRRSEARHG